MRLKIEKVENSEGYSYSWLRSLAVDVALILVTAIYLKEGKLLVSQLLQVLMFLGLMWRVDEWLFRKK